jgi:hypothetical protein
MYSNLTTEDLEDEKNQTALVPKGGLPCPICDAVEQYRLWRRRFRNSVSDLCEHNCGGENGSLAATIT